MKDAEFYRRFDEIVPGMLSEGAKSEEGGLDIYFECLSLSGLDEMHRYSADQRLYEFFEFEPFKSIDDTRAYIEKLLRRIGDVPGGRTAMYWFVRRKSDGYLIGSANLVALNYPRQSVEWGYGVDPALWGQGYVLQIQHALKHYVFEVLELNRLHGITMVTNERTISSVRAAGMKHEGTLRDYYCKDGVFVDGWLYSMLRRDYFRMLQENPVAGGLISIGEIVEIVASVLTEECISEDSSMSEVLSWDSLNHMGIMQALTEKTGISLSPSDVTHATSIKAIASLLNRARTGQE